MSASRRELLWQRLREAGLVEGELPAERRRSPWFVRVMLGVAGWLGALFLIGFVAVGLAFVVESPPAAIVAGALACGAVALVFRAQRPGDVLAQSGLAVSLAGQALMAYGILRVLEASSSGAAFALAVQQALLFALVPHFVHRVWAAWSAACALMYALAGQGLAALLPPLFTGGVLAVWLREFEHARHGELVRAGGYGLALAAVQATVMHGSFALLGLAGIVGAREALYGWPAALATGAVLIVATLALLRREGVAIGSGPARAALAAAALLALVSLKAPGVATATAILVVGYANGNRILAGLGLFALIGYLSHYYYSLHATLLEKSALLASAGVALLAARFALRRWWPEPEAADA